MIDVPSNEILRRWKAGESQMRIADSLGVNQSTVSKLLKRLSLENLDQQSPNGTVTAADDPFRLDFRWETRLPNGTVVPLEPKDDLLYTNGLPKSLDKNGHSWSPQTALHTRFGTLLQEIVARGEEGKTPWQTQRHALQYIIAEGILQLHRHYCTDKAPVDAFESWLHRMTDRAKDVRQHRVMESVLAAERPELVDMLRAGDSAGLLARVRDYVTLTNQLQDVDAGFWYRKSVRMLLADGVVMEVVRKLREGRFGEEAAVVQFSEWTDRYG